MIYSIKCLLLCAGCSHLSKQTFCHLRTLQTVSITLYCRYLSTHSLIYSNVNSWRREISPKITPNGGNTGNHHQRQALSPFANEKTSSDMTLRSGCKQSVELRFQPMDVDLQGNFYFNNKSYKPPLFPFLLSCQIFAPGTRTLAQPWALNRLFIIYFSAFPTSLPLKSFQLYLS